MLQGLDNLECSNVLTLSPTELSMQCGLNTLLPRGRLNGLHNMVTLIQSQISRELQRKKGETASIEESDGEKKVFNSLSSNLFKSDYNIELEGADTSDEVAVLLSGGVDSSVALKLLQLQGHKVRAFYLKIWLEDEVAHLNE
jgi:predicted PP-loop superfamily ATPase